MKDYQELLNSIKRGVIDPVYLLYGTETYLTIKAVTALKKFVSGGDLGDFNLTIMDASVTKVEDILDAANTVPFFTDRRLVLVQDAPYFRSKRKKDGSEEDANPGDERVLKYLDNPNPSTCLVFLAGESINKRMKTVKAVEKVGRVFEFAKLKRTELDDWVKSEFTKRGKKIEPTAVQYLTANNPDDLGILSGEIEKLSLLDIQQEKITLHQVQGSSSCSIEASIFDLVDHIGEKQTAKAITKLRDIMQHGEPAVKTLAMISRQMRLILAAKSLSDKGYPQQEMISALGVHPYTGGKALRQARNFSISQLEMALETCLEVDLALKSSRGWPPLLLETAIISIVTGKWLKLSS